MPFLHYRWSSLLAFQTDPVSSMAGLPPGPEGGYRESGHGVFATGHRSGCVALWGLEYGLDAGKAQQQQAVPLGRVSLPGGSIPRLHVHIW